MAEELLKGPGRNGDAIERADRMISRLRPDPASVSKVKRNACEDDRFEGASLLPLLPVL